MHISCMKTSMLSVDCHAQIQIVTFLINELKDRLIWWSFTSNIDSYQPHLVFWIWRRKQVWSNVAGKALVIIFLDKYKAFSSLPELQFEWGSDREQHNLLVTMIWLVLTVKVNLLYSGRAHVEGSESRHQRLARLLQKWGLGVQSGWTKVWCNS